MNSVLRKPDVRVIIKRPDWADASKLTEYTIVTFEPRPCSLEEKSRAKEKWEKPDNYDAHSDAMLAYSYSESRQSVDSPFTFSLTPEEDSNGRTWIDKIDMMDIVYIEEFGKVRYCGIVHRIRYSARMGQDGPGRTITVSGNGFGELLKTFQLVLDNKLFINAKSGETASKVAAAELVLDGDSSMKKAMTFYYDNFRSLIAEMPSQKQSVLGMLLDDKLDLSLLGSTCATLVPICQSMYITGQNTIWDIWRKIVPTPAFELFGYWSGTKYVLVARPCPFEATDWVKLASCKLNPIALTSYDIGADDTEIYTYFYGTASSLGITSNMSLVIDNFKNTHTIDKEKWMKYGYRPLNVELSFLKRSDADIGAISESLKKISESLANWYALNDEFLSGTISIISVDDKGLEMEYPSVGIRLLFLGGEFYIDEIQRKWTYGASPTTDIKVLRGYMYSASGEYAGPIRNLGKRLKEMETLKTKDAQ